jgi:hypothetical protein
VTDGEAEFIYGRLLLGFDATVRAGCRLTAGG